MILEHAHYVTFVYTAERYTDACKVESGRWFLSVVDEALNAWCDHALVLLTSPEGFLVLSETGNPIVSNGRGTQVILS